MKDPCHFEKEKCTHVVRVSRQVQQRKQRQSGKNVCVCVCWWCVYVCGDNSVYVCVGGCVCVVVCVVCWW